MMDTSSPKKKVSFATPFLPEVSRCSTVEVIHTTKNTRVVKPDYKSWIQNITPLSKVLDEHLKKKTNKQTIYTHQNVTNSDILIDSFLIPANNDDNSDNRRRITNGNTRIQKESKDKKDVNKLTRQAHTQMTNKSLRRKNVNLQVIGTILKMRNELQMIRERKDKIYKKSDAKVFVTVGEE